MYALSTRAKGWRLVAFLFALIATVLLLPAPAFAAGDPPATAGSVVTTTAMWGVIVGILTPPLVAVVQQPSWSRATRTYVGVGVAVVFAALTCWVDGSIGHGQTLIVTIGTVLIASQTTYRELWSKVGATQAIEAKTSGADTVQSPFPPYGSAPRIPDGPGDGRATTATKAKAATKTPAKAAAKRSSTRPAGGSRSSGSTGSSR